MNGAPLFVIKMCIVPQELCFSFEGIPAFEVAHACSRLPAVNALDQFLEALEGEWLLDDGEVIFVAPWGQIDEIQEVRIAVSGQLLQWIRRLVLTLHRVCESAPRQSSLGLPGS